MRSPLSQFQTPTTPRRVVGFFGSGCPAGCPAEPITQSTSDWLILLEPILSIVDGAEAKWSVSGCQRRFSVQSPNVVHPLMDERNLSRVHSLRLIDVLKTVFYTELSTRWPTLPVLGISPSCRIFAASALVHSGAREGFRQLRESQTTGIPDDCLRIPVQKGKSQRQSARSGARIPMQHGLSSVPKPWL